MLIVTVINFLILFTLSAIHCYWAFGGQWGFASALPTDAAGRRLLNPKTIDSLIVAFGLMIFAAYLLLYARLVSIYLPNWILEYGIWLIIGIFLLRVIGDFRYVGFFKKIQSTDFAKKDNKYFSPLCLWLGLSCLLIKLITII